MFSSIYAQPELDIRPGSIRFEDYFHRLENVYFINKGDQRLQVDSISYKNNYYFIRFASNYSTPFYIEPGDSVLMDCILAGYLYVPISDTTDTMYVYSNSRTGVEDIRVKIDYFDDDYNESVISGIITSGGIPVAGADVYFFAGGNILVDSAKTDLAGNYSVNLYPGDYLIAAEKEFHYLTFFDGKPDPFTANLIHLEEFSSAVANIDLVPSVATSYSISGKITDSLTNAPLKKAVIVVKKGTHTPGKRTNLNFDGGIYTTIAKSDGSYIVPDIMIPDFYYLQAFSNYYVPGYYTLANASAVFWQNADTLLVNSSLINKDVKLLRDSSYGGGQAIGQAVTQGENILFDVMVYAQPVNSHNLYTFGSARDTGYFKVNYIPYGTYNLIGQKTGFEDAYYGPIVIDSLNTDISGILLVFNLLSGEQEPYLPAEFVLHQNYPNPFNPITNFDINVPYETDINLKVYSILGELVSTLYNGNLKAGNYTFRFDASKLSSGTYLVVMNTGNNIYSRKILLLK
jgi:hypothetical protein